MTRLREHTATATSGAINGLYIGALVSGIGWVLYLPGHVTADVFVAVLLLGVVMGVVAVVGAPVYVATALLQDRLCGKGEQR